MTVTKEKILIVSENLVVVSLEIIELALVLVHLEHNDWCRTHAAKSIGMSLRTMRNKINTLKLYGFDIPESKYDPRKPSRKPKPKTKEPFKRRKWVTYEYTGRQDGN